MYFATSARVSGKSGADATASLNPLTCSVDKPLAVRRPAPAHCCAFSGFQAGRTSTSRLPVVGGTAAARRRDAALGSTPAGVALWSRCGRRSSPGMVAAARRRWRDRGRTGPVAAPLDGLESPSTVPPFGRRSGQRRCSACVSWRTVGRGVWCRESGSELPSGRSCTARIAHPDLRYGQIGQFRIA